MFLFLLFCLFSDGLFRLVQFFVYLFFRSVFVALFLFSRLLLLFSCASSNCMNQNS